HADFLLRQMDWRPPVSKKNICTGRRGGLPYPFLIRGKIHAVGGRDAMLEFWQEAGRKVGLNHFTDGCRNRAASRHRFLSPRPADIETELTFGAHGSAPVPWQPRN